MRDRRRLRRALVHAGQRIGLVVHDDENIQGVEFDHMMAKQANTAFRVNSAAARVPEWHRDHDAHHHDLSSIGYAIDALPPVLRTWPPGLWGTYGSWKRAFPCSTARQHSVSSAQ